MVGSGKKSPVYENERSKNSKYTVQGHKISGPYHVCYIQYVYIQYVDGLSTLNTFFGSVKTMEDRNFFCIKYTLPLEDRIFSTFQN